MAAQALDLLLQQARPEIRAMHPYEPGKPVETLERELGIREAIKLASNENPRGPGASVREALAREAADLSRYPDGSAHAFREKLAAQQGLHPDQILLGNGSNDVLELIARVFLAPGRKGVIDQYAFVVYPLAIAGAGGTVCAVPSRAYGHDLPAMAAAVDDSTQLVFIANPNNPTGTVASLTEIE
ncbi:MAG: aminotransferase class I/II-fold pyridoxal phosphate-dependent enzyme, partial [Pseudomonadales bacterium]